MAGGTHGQPRHWPSTSRTGRRSRVDHPPAMRPEQRDPPAGPSHGTAPGQPAGGQWSTSDHPGKDETRCGRVSPPGSGAAIQLGVHATAPVDIPRPAPVDTRACVSPVGGSPPRPSDLGLVPLRLPGARPSNIRLHRRTAVDEAPRCAGRPNPMSTPLGSSTARSTASDTYSLKRRDRRVGSRVTAPFRRWGWPQQDEPELQRRTASKVTR
jgi:hypothetical protein